jgi:hypothetical protein
MENTPKARNFLGNLLEMIWYVRNPNKILGHREKNLEPSTKYNYLKGKRINFRKSLKILTRSWLAPKRISKHFYTHETSRCIGRNATHILPFI